MRCADIFAIVRRAAEISGCAEFVVIGSQAIHGSVQDPDIDAVIRSNDVDMYPRDGYTPAVWEELMLRLGQDSDFHLQSGTYVEAVPTDLARFPQGWEDRGVRLSAGTVIIAGRERAVYVFFPEIHDLAVSKIAIGREKDLEFLDGIVDLELVDRNVLLERYETAPRISDERLAQGLADIGNAFDRRENKRGRGRGR